VHDPDLGQLLRRALLLTHNPAACRIDLPQPHVDHTPLPMLAIHVLTRAVLNGSVGTPALSVRLRRVSLALTDALGIRNIAIPATANAVLRAGSTPR